jgi:dsRNA-specific ribonuclease
VEALIGAVYLDAGYRTAERLVHHLYEGVDINPHMRAVQRPQDRTAGMAAGPRMKLPQYQVVEISGRRTSRPSRWPANRRIHLHARAQALAPCWSRQPPLPCSIN